MSVSRKELEQQQRRRYILDCAEKLFAEKGFVGVTVADIAHASEFAVGTLYQFFEGKEELIKNLLLERMEQISTILEEQLSKDIPARQKLENSIDKLVAMVVEHIDFFKLYMMEIKGAEWGCPSGRYGEEIHRIVKSQFDHMVEIFRQGIEDGSFRKDIDPVYMALFLNSSLHSFLGYSMVVGPELSVENVRKEMRKILYYGILPEGGAKDK